MTKQATERTAKIISDNWQRVLQQVSNAGHAASRRDEVAIIGVSKYVGPELSTLR